MVRGKKVILERVEDYDLLKSMDGKLDTLVTGHAVLCKQVEINTGVISSHGRLLTWVERIVYTAIGGGTVAIVIIKLVLPMIIK